MDRHNQLNPDQWLEKHGDALFRYAMLRLRDRDQAEDAVQETFVAAMKARANYSGRASERTWLVGILKNKVIDLQRRAFRERPRSELESGENEDWVDNLFDGREHWKEPPASWSDPRDALQDQEFWSVFRQCLDGLSSRHAESFVLRVLEQLSTEEICKNLGISETNLGVILYRARLQLRKCLEMNWFNPPPEKRER